MFPMSWVGCDGALKGSHANYSDDHSLLKYYMNEKGKPHLICETFYCGSLKKYKYINDKREIPLIYEAILYNIDLQNKTYTARNFHSGIPGILYV